MKRVERSQSIRDYIAAGTLAVAGLFGCGGGGSSTPAPVQTPAPSTPTSPPDKIFGEFTDLAVLDGEIVVEDKRFGHANEIRRIETETGTDKLIARMDPDTNLENAVKNALLTSEEIQVGSRQVRQYAAIDALTGAKHSLAASASTTQWLVATGKDAALLNDLEVAGPNPSYRSTMSIARIQGSGRTQTVTTTDAFPTSDNVHYNFGNIDGKLFVVDATDTSTSTPQGTTFSTDYRVHRWNAQQGTLELLADLSGRGNGVNQILDTTDKVIAYSSGTFINFDRILQNGQTQFLGQIGQSNQSNLYILGMNEEGALLLDRRSTGNIMRYVSFGNAQNTNLSITTAPGLEVNPWNSALLTGSGFLVQAELQQGQNGTNAVLVEYDHQTKQTDVRVPNTTPGPNTPTYAQMELLGGGETGVIRVKWRDALGDYHALAEVVTKNGSTAPATTQNDVSYFRIDKDRTQALFNTEREVTTANGSSVWETELWYVAANNGSVQLAKIGTTERSPRSIKSGSFANQGRQHQDISGFSYDINEWTGQNNTELFFVDEVAGLFQTRKIAEDEYAYMRGVVESTRQGKVVLYKNQLGQIYAVPVNFAQPGSNNIPLSGTRTPIMYE